MIRRLTIAAVATVVLACLHASPAAACGELACDEANPDVRFTPGSVTASSLVATPGSALRIASNAVSEHFFSLMTPCQLTDGPLGGCTPGGATCPQVDGRVIDYYIVFSQRLVQPDR